MDVFSNDSVDMLGISPEVLLPSQFRDLHNNPSLSPEQRLIYAVLTNALDDATGRALSGKTKRRRASARAWIEEDDKCPMSFCWCCEALKLDEIAIRREVLAVERRIRLRSNSHVSRPAVNGLMFRKHSRREAVRV